MKKLLIFLLLIFPLFIFLALFFIDKTYFLCPIQYRTDIVVRADARGDGVFAAKRNGHRMHNGIDLYAPVGTPVFACRFGKVSAVSEIKQGMGKYVVISHLGGLNSIYGHLSVIYVSKGKFVRQGQIIGLSGKTGNADFHDIQPHLHFEVRKGGVPQDPLEYLQ